jgi:hypothetical protein
MKTIYVITQNVRGTPSQGEQGDMLTCLHTVDGKPTPAFGNRPLAEEYLKREDPYHWCQITPLLVVE